MAQPVIIGRIALHLLDQPLGLAIAQCFGALLASLAQRGGRGVVPADLDALALLVERGRVCQQALRFAIALCQLLVPGPLAFGIGTGLDLQFGALANRGLAADLGKQRAILGQLEGQRSFLLHPVTFGLAAGAALAGLLGDRDRRIIDIVADQSGPLVAHHRNRKAIVVALVDRLLHHLDPAQAFGIVRIQHVRIGSRVAPFGAVAGDFIGAQPGQHRAGLVEPAQLAQGVDGEIADLEREGRRKAGARCQAFALFGDPGHPAAALFGCAGNPGGALQQVESLPGRSAQLLRQPDQPRGPAFLAQRLIFRAGDQRRQAGDFFRGIGFLAVALFVAVGHQQDQPVRGAFGQAGIAAFHSRAAAIGIALQRIGDERGVLSELLAADRAGEFLLAARKFVLVLGKGRGDQRQQRGRQQGEAAPHSAALRARCHSGASSSAESRAASVLM